MIETQASKNNLIKPFPSDFRTEFSTLLPEIQTHILSNLNKRSDINACLRTHRMFEQIIKPLWGWFLRRHFPYSCAESQSGIFGVSLLKHLSIIDNTVRDGMCLFEAKCLVPQFGINDLKGFFRLHDALKIHNGTLFHIGFGDRDGVRNTTIDSHYCNDGFNLERRSASYRIPRDDVISTCVHGDLIYLGTMNGDLSIVDHKKSLLVGTIQTGGELINCIHIHNDRICASDFMQNRLWIHHLVGGKVVSSSIQVESEILSMQSHQEDLYCITASGAINVVDVEKSIVTHTIMLPNKMAGRPLIKGGFLFSSFSKKLKVWDLENKKLSYSYSFQKIVTAIGVQGEYVFVGLIDGSIHVLNRGSGAYLSKIYYNSVDNCGIAGFNFFGNTLYAYTGAGEIVSIKLDLSFSTPFSKRLKEISTTLGHIQLSFLECRLFEGPDRIFF